MYPSAGIPADDSFQLSPKSKIIYIYFLVNIIYNNPVKYQIYVYFFEVSGLSHPLLNV